MQNVGNQRGFPEAIAKEWCVIDCFQELSLDFIDVLEMRELVPIYNIAVFATGRLKYCGIHEFRGKLCIKSGSLEDSAI